MNDKWERSHRNTHYDNVTYPALKTVGQIEMLCKDKHHRRVYVRIFGDKLVRYRPVEIEPLEILIDIFDEYRYMKALKQLDNLQTNIHGMVYKYQSILQSN